jgi:hypothetical protein
VYGLFNDPAPNQHPNQHDYNQLVSIYSHLESTSTTSARTPQGAPERELDVPSE